MKRYGEELMKKARRIWSHMWFLWNQCIFIYIFHIWNYYILYLTQVNYYMSNLQKKWMEMVRNSWNRTVSAIVTLVTVWPHVTGSGGYRELFNSICSYLDLDHCHASRLEHDFVTTPNLSPSIQRLEEISQLIGARKQWHGQQ